MNTLGRRDGDPVQTLWTAADVPRLKRFARRNDVAVRIVLSEGGYYQSMDAGNGSMGLLVPEGKVMIQVGDGKAELGDFFSRYSKIKRKVSCS